MLNESRGAKGAPTLALPYSSQILIMLIITVLVIQVILISKLMIVIQHPWIMLACAGESGETGQSCATGDGVPDPQWRPLRGWWGSLARDHHWAFPGDMPRLADQADVAISAW